MIGVGEDLGRRRKTGDSELLQVGGWCNIGGWENVWFRLFVVIIKL